MSFGTALDDEEDDADRDELNAEANEVAGDELLRREARVADDAADAGAAPGRETYLPPIAHPHPISGRPSPISKLRKKIKF